MKQPLPPWRLSFEQLEDRTTPAWGVPWFDGSSLTLSFVPDGTNISGTPSNLFSHLGATMSQPQWQREILRAYQTWAVNANLNIGLVLDGGQPMGIAGPPQEDVRFGDIRIGARPLSLEGDEHANMAGATGFDYDSKTWAGDLVFNSQFPFGIGGTPGQQSDLFSVALHESAHSFGLPDRHDDPTSVLWARYEGVISALSAADIEAIQALYGPRVDDPFEGFGNGTPATAFNLTTNGNLSAVAADITRLGDVDCYRFTTPSLWSGVNGLTVSLQAAKVSLLTARLTVLDSQGNPVASVVTTDPLNNNLSVAIPNYQPSSTYYVKVEGADSDVFSIGAYVLRLNESPANPFAPNGSVTSSYHTNVEFGYHPNLASAQVLSPVRAARGTTFTVAGMITSASDVDWYKITPSAPTAFTGTLFIGTMTTTNGLLPTVSVYNTAGQLLPSSVVMNDSGSYVIQLANASTGTSYFVRIASAATSGGRSSGIYTLGATLAPVAPVQFDSLASNGMTTSTAVQYSQMTVEGDRLTQFALSATGGSAVAATAVRLTMFDSTGRAVFTTVAQAGQPISTGLVWLASGTYTLVFNAATQNGTAIGSLMVDLAARVLSDPIDPYIEDPIAPPAPEEPPITLEPVELVPPLEPILDPIANPFDRLLWFA